MESVGLYLYSIAYQLIINSLKLFRTQSANKTGNNRSFVMKFKPSETLELCKPSETLAIYNQHLVLEAGKPLHTKGLADSNRNQRNRKLLLTFN
jgi:hypothetical protein